MPIRFGLVGGGWRAEFFTRIDGLRCEIGPMISEKRTCAASSSC